MNEHRLDQVRPMLSGRRLRLLVERRRRPLAAACAAVAALAALHVVHPPLARTATVLLAAHDLPAGAVLAGADVRTAQLPTGLTPTGALVDPAGAVGRTLAGPVRAGEVLTDVRLTGSALLAGTAPDGLEAVPVRLSDADAAALLQPGDLVDVIAAAAPAGAAPATASVVAPHVRVLAVPARQDALGAAPGALVVVAATASQARDLAAAAVDGHLSVALLPR